MAREAEERTLGRLQAIVPRNTQERIKKPIASTQCSTTIIGDHLDAMTPLHSKLYTKAPALSTRGIADLGVKIDGNSVHNLLPRSIASRLGLPIHFGKNIRMKVANYII